MGLINILQNIARKKLSSGDSNKPLVITNAPLGLHQGSVVSMPDIDLALAQVDGSIINAPKGDQIVTAIGQYSLFGKRIYNAYLGDGSSYIRVVTGSGSMTTVEEVTLWCSNAEILPHSVEDWEFWLGSYQKDASGEFIRGEDGVALRNEYGLIGWNQFQIDGPPPAIYDRAWMQSDGGVDPIAYTETITDSFGGLTTVKHEAMEYQRKLTESDSSTVESLYASMSQTIDGASVNVFIGLGIQFANLKVLAA